MQRLHNSRARLLIGASVIALCATPLAAPAMAQTTTPAAAPATTDATGPVVVVTARRKALQTATERKKNADTIVDSIVADEAGKLPDTSLTEVLQRVAGVTITRFASLGSPDQFSFEGTGIQVRGLSGVTGLLNGREIFSANGGSGLNWGDVTPELMSAVDVYKASEADLIEGGTGGAIDLRTRMPFDYKKPEFDFSAQGSYGDFSKKWSPEVSGLVTDRWDTPIGEIGALVDLSYSEYYYADSFARTEPYYQEAGATAGSKIYVPGGFDYGNDEFDRKREGFYEALQWKPNSDLTFWQTAFAANYQQDNSGGGVFVAQDCCATPGSNDVFDAKGVFQSGSIFYGSAASPAAFPGNANNYTPSNNTTADFSEGFSWTPTQKLRIQGAAQVVESGAWAGDYGLGIGSGAVYQENLTVNGKLPLFTLPGANITQPASNDSVNNIIWNNQKNHAQEIALNLDVDYDLGDGFFKEVKGGVRYATRQEKDDFTGTWWSPTDRGWNGAPQLYASTPGLTNDFALYTFPNFFKGKLPVPSSYVFFINDHPGSFKHDVDTYTADLGQTTANSACPNEVPALPAGSPDSVNFGNCPNDTTTKTTTTDAYLKAKFGHDAIGWFPAFTGNIGVRVVHDTVDAIGDYSVAGGPTSQGFYQTATDAATSFTDLGGLTGYAAATQAGTVPKTLPLEQYLTSVNELRSEKNQYTRALPDFNVAFKPNSQWVIRVAVDQTMSPPNFNDIRASGSTSLGTQLQNPENPIITAYNTAHANVKGFTPLATLPNIFEGFSNSSGDPYLKPAISTNEDLSIEWYPSSGTTAHVDFFNKDIKDLIIYNSSSFTTAVGTTGPEGPLSGADNGTQDYNAGGTSTIQGVELGGRTYFDFLPGALKGIGIEANYTAIKSSAPNSVGFYMDGSAVKGLPVVGLSTSNYNMNLLYDLGSWDARLAYSWRSKYLATTTGNGTTSTYTSPITGQSIAFSLPVYGAAIGQLDASVSYKINDHFSIYFNGSNLLNNISKTSMEILPGDFVTRSWFMNDVRYNIGLHAKF